MTKIIYFFLLIAAPFVVITVVHAAPVPDQPRPKKAIICGHVHKVGTKLFKSTPVIYMITQNGRAYTLYPGTESSSPAKLTARLEVMEKLMWVESACLAGTALNEVFFPDAFVDPGTRGQLAEQRERAQASRQTATAARGAQPPASARATTAPRPAAQPRRQDWVPWQSANTIAP